MIGTVLNGRGGMVSGAGRPMTEISGLRPGGNITATATAFIRVTGTVVTMTITESLNNGRRRWPTEGHGNGSGNRDCAVLRHWQAPIKLDNLLQIEV